MSAYYLKESKGEKVFYILNYIFLFVLSLTTLYPLYHVIIASVSDGNKLIAHSGLLFKPVGGFTLEAYTAVLTNPNILNGYLNTVFLLAVGITLQVAMTALGAYFFSRRNVLFKNVLMFLIVFTMFFEGGIVPFFLVCKDLSLINKRMSLVLPFLVSAYNMIIMRTSFASIPASLEESAKLDGAKHIDILFKIVLPLSKAVIAVMILYYGVGIWNSWFWASVFLRDREKYPLQLILREILIANDMSAMETTVDDVGIGESIKYATILVATLPILMVYPFLQRYFVKGVMIGAIKG